MPQEVEQVQTSAPVGWSGKMSPELSAPTKERTLGQSSKKQSKSQSRKPPLFLSLRTDGQQPDKQNFNSVIDTERLTVRRLTPLECERLQGFPDGWTDIGAWVGENGKSHAESADTARYKALGNSIALPPWAYVLTRLSLCVGCGHPTMASLFDGIGGFPLIWEWLNGKGSCLWASEIEDFPIAVTKYHFPEEGENNEH